MTGAEPAQRGFTLVEVMVALVIVAFVLPARLMGFNQQADGISYLREKSVAHWVASNKLTETRLQVSRSGRLFQGRRNGSAEMLERDWFWWISSEPTEVEDFYRVEIKVATSEDGENRPLVTIVGFIAAAQGERSGP